MPTFADLNGIPIISGRITLPMFGIWHADVLLGIPTGIAGPQILTLLGQPYVCFVVRAIEYSGARSVRVVGGLGGWRKKISAKQYHSPVGVPGSLVLADAAAEAKEVPPVPSPFVPATLGKDFVRVAGPASLVLSQVCGTDGWWMDPKGVIQTFPRLPTPIVTPFTATAVRGAAGLFVIATDFPVQWTPGVVFANGIVSGTVNRVTHVIEKDTFRTEVMGP